MPDTSTEPRSSAHRFRVAVVGSGPAGMVLALELAERGCLVTLVESGEKLPLQAAQRLSDAKIADQDAHVPMDQAVQRRFGGTSHLWGGRCVPYDRIDFVSRPGVRSECWPIASEDLDPYWEKACGYADCGPSIFSYREAVSEDRAQPLVEGFVDGRVTSSRLERWSSFSKLVVRLGPMIEGHPNIVCRFGFTVVGARSDKESGRMEALIVRATAGAPEDSSPICADHFVLACGGVETTRLLLMFAKREQARVDGRVHLGRYYMGHLGGKIADVQFSGGARNTVHGFERSSGYYVRRRFTFTDDVLLTQKLLNIAIWLDNPPPADAAHKSGILSAAYLALRTPWLQDRLAPAAIRNAMFARAKGSIWQHVLNVLRDPIATPAFIVPFVIRRYFSRRRLPGFFIHSPANRYALNYHSEQTPSVESSIALSEERDALGSERARIELRFKKEDAQSVVAAHAVLDDYLKELGVGKLVYRFATEDLVNAVLKQARDGMHQLGTTRMSLSAQDGVTDEYGRVHGMSNLHVCSASLFPTSGQANPTLTLIAFAIRQAERLSTLAVPAGRSATPPLDRTSVEPR